MKKNALWALALLALGLFIFFFRLGALPLLDPDEPRYAQAAREMLETGDWINPQLNGEPRWDKPVLFYWLVLWSYQVFGISEWSARFPSALFAVLSLVLVFAWSWRLKEPRRGLLSAVILATNVEFFMVARLAITDMPLCFFESLALVFAFESWRTGRRSLMTFCYAAAALAFLTKGPVGILLPALIFFIFLALGRNLSFLKEAKMGAGLVIFLLLALPWYLAEGYLYRDFFSYFFVLHNLKRFATTDLGHAEPLFYYAGVLALGFFPWVVVLPRTLWRTLRAYWKEPQSLFLFIWIVVTLVFFSLSGAKLPTYILGVFLPLSLLTARAWQELFEKARGDVVLRLEAILMTSIATALTAAGGYFWAEKFPGEWPLFLGAALPTLTGFVLVPVFAFTAGPRWVFRTTVLSFLAGAILYVQILGPGFARTRSLKDFAREIQSQPGGASAPVGSFRIFKPSLVFYLGRQVRLLENPDALSSFMNRASKVFCVMRERAFHDPQIRDILKRSNLIKQAHGKALITNQDSGSVSERD